MPKVGGVAGGGRGAASGEVGRAKNGGAGAWRNSWSAWASDAGRRTRTSGGPVGERAAVRRSADTAGEVDRRPAG